MNRFYRLLAFGYFPKEIPPVLWTGDFATSVARVQAGSSLSQFVSNTWTKPSLYVLQQRARYRRPLTIPNPNSFVQASDIIAGQFSAVQALLSKSKISLSTPKFNRKTKYYRSVGPNISGDDLRLRRLELRSSHPFVLRFDIKNFYRSIYTHSIEWAAVGKGVAKATLRAKGSSNLGKLLDNAVRTGQDGQTIGIPVGPDTSFIIGELLLAAIDDCLGLNRKQALRFYDDYEVGVSSEGEAEELLQIVESAFANFELELNPEKSHVVRNSEDLDTAWRLQIKLATKDKPKRPDELVDLFAFACSLARQNRDDFVLGYFLRRMRMFVLPENLWSAWQQILMATAFAEFGALRSIYEQFDLYGKVGYRIDKSRISEALREKLRRELQGAVSSELSWVLFGFLKFNLPIDQDGLEQVLLRGDDVSRILAIKIADTRNVSIKKKVNQLVTAAGPVSATSEHWLLFWEIYRNGWASGSTLKTTMLSEPIFTLLDKDSVSFLRDPAIDLLEIPSSFQEAIEKVHGAGEATRLADQIKKTFDFSTEDRFDGDDEDEEDDSRY